MDEQQRGVRHPADDVEGHASTPTDVAEPAQDDVDGHRWRGGVTDEPEPEDHDVAGHASRFGGVTDEPVQGDDDVAGHGVRVRI